MHFSGKVSDKKVLIVDDMITTGGTIVKAAQLLYNQGAQSVRVAATHGVFTKDALLRIEASCITQVYVTNTLIQTRTSGKITVVDITPFIQKIMQAQ